ncbi:UDP-glucoronosyl and UDP-glucosyl transferase [Ilyonectria robusta]|uniref:UDP-glucoronosyl and UDP-glucosyl transferase n=1 Tax=Ilyonectria robusta TaxID=1079257 RepID=UPI001E8ED766|nr:UDP-glucoronosyl and UDP-glucosyl transferase [Ilyonectria robusta]KAH8736186.1 UDP-glucoronosyl and UDP-glucosyl transferase [Ilyonectria robusta]
MANLELAHPSRKILLVVTTGGFTHASPVFEIGGVLAARGHTVEFATLDGQDGWTKDYEFITKVHSLGPGPTSEQMNAHYLRMRTWDISKGISGTMPSKYLWDSFWPQTYRGLKAIMDDPDTRPSMMIADFFVDAVKDIHVEYNLPIAQVWPQMPFLMMPCSYIPGEPGFQLEGTLTSENASIWLRMRNELVIYFDLPVIMKWMRWTKQMRLKNGVTYPTHRIQKPDYLIFINSFLGLEIPRDLPPTCAPIGPLIRDTYPPLNEECHQFLSQHTKVIYIALGTHIILTNADAAKIINGLLRLMEEGLIDGVIWSIGKSGRQDFDLNTTYNMKKPSGGNKTIRLSDLLSGKDPNWLCSFFVPQRSILDHPSTKIYFTHGGGSSANEGLFHGVPMLSMGVFMDQISNTTRLVAGGVAQPLNKFRFTSEELYTKGKEILADKDGSYQRNSLRLMRIAHVASRRKHHAADLVEELMYDTELRFKDGKELRPMHLQTADMRMPAWKAKNWDLWAVSLLGMSAVFGGLGIGGRMLWFHRGGLIESVKALGNSEWLRNLAK